MRRQAEQLQSDIDELERQGLVAPPVASVLGKLALATQQPLKADFYQIEGGRLPETKTEGAIGHDAYARAIVDPRHRFDDDEPFKRRALVNFEDEPVEERYKLRKKDDPDGSGRYGIVVPVGETELVGLGFCTAMEHPGFYWIAPRSGLSSRGITVANSPGTVDADYRGEAGALIHNIGVLKQLRSQGFDYEADVAKYFTPEGGFILTKNLRIAQVIFGIGVQLDQNVVEAHQDLGQTERGQGGFGSTGLTG